jgi:phosphatidylglycerophosphate synthase
MQRPTKQEVLSIPNAISAAGVGLVVKGSLESDNLKAATYTGIGRALDLVDGPVARLTHQESDFGAKVDAVFDKLGMLAIMAGSLYHDRIPKPAAAAVITHNVINTGVSIMQEVKHPDTPVRPTKAGKVGLFLENIGVLSYMAASAIESRTTHNKNVRALTLAGHALTATGVGLGLIAGSQYVRRAATDSQNSL